MGLFHRRDRPPAAAVACVGSDERVVSWGDTDESAVLATPRGLWWPDGPTWRLIGWHAISKAVWREGVLTVIEADVVDDLLLADRLPVHARLTVPRDLPPTVRKRVEANVVRSELSPVTGGTVRLVGRRVPGEDGLHWWARLEGGTPDTPEIRSAVAARLSLLRADYEQEHQAGTW